METYLHIWQFYSLFNTNLLLPKFRLPNFKSIKKFGKTLLGLTLITTLNINIPLGNLSKKYALADNVQVKGAATIAPEKDEEKLKIKLPSSKKEEIKINDILNPSLTWEGLVSQAQIVRAEKEAQILVQKQAEIEAQKTVLLNSGLKQDFTELYKSVSETTGVPWQILAAVHQVETGQSGDTTKSSYAGAQGPMQFIPSTFKAYAKDGNGDGVANIHSVYDAMHTAGNYLRANGAASGNVHNALFRYNHSEAYINKVLGIAKNLGYQG